VKILTVLGTRPEIIRLSLVIRRLDDLCNHVLVHTGQNFDPDLSDLFFEQLAVRKPDYFLGIRAESFGEQIGKIIIEVEKVLLKEKPDRLLVLGDTNSSLAAIVAKRLGIPVYHMEAGNRCYDDRVPEEVNRRIVDHSSDVLMPYTERSRANLLREGISGESIFVIGNPINEVMRHSEQSVIESNILRELGLEGQGFILVSMHRAENVDVEERLKSLVSGFEMLQKEYRMPLICSTHPRTASWMKRYHVGVENDQIKFLKPFGFFDFLALERNAFCVVSDSGTVQEECCILRVANVTIRDVTERPETLECGSNMLSGAEPDSLLRCVRTVLKEKPSWGIPPEYLVENASSTVAKIVLGYRR
jgi:UDP-N-acetylglucosamine 2-epimerase (non-hydrolysing)